ncbi:uncharacterized protein LOC103510254 isoform X3 [Diaphorina citri]|uniref:Uncharacterized protein LOC103510254 isoform X3 n=1 Tax=Diaphorina citri TaxID=121845 RepID=A0A3Q0IV52_DIACI|nr:uncharacterized protein LOC103510254 isoform X3 [Diaphorina citri]
MVKNEMISSVVLSNLYLLVLLSPSSSQDHNSITKLSVPHKLSTPQKSQNISNLNIPQDMSNLNSPQDLNSLQNISKLNFPQDYLHSSSNLNTLTDTLLKVGLPLIDSDLPVPDLNKEITMEVLFMKITTFKLTTQGGHITDLRSLRRQGNTTLTKHGDIYRFQSILGFENLAVIYPHYTVKALYITKSGAIKAVVEDNQFLLDFHLKKNKKECKLLFNSLKFLNFKHIDVTISGGWWSGLDWAWSRIVTLIINKFRNNIKIQLEKKLSTTISKLLADSEKTFCKLIG